MTEETHGVTEVASSGNDGGQLMSIGAVAAHNIAQALEYGPETVPVIETAIKSEIDAMSSHFALAFRDVQDAHEIAEMNAKKEFDIFVASTKAREQWAVEQFQEKVAEIKSTWSYVEANKVCVFAALAGAVAIGVIVGLILAQI
jgi:hypothetical protein